MRPADATEAAECWQIALESEKTPSTLALTRQNLPALRTEFVKENLCAKGAYELAGAEGGEATVTIFATGSEVEIALGARKLLQGHGHPTRVVSVPCFELFAAQDEAYREKILGKAGLKMAIEAGIREGWDALIGADGIFIGMKGFGASGTIEQLYPHFGITAEAAAEAAEKRLHVLQSLDALGAGFTLASHDLDIRGAGNLLGDEQSGHIKEVGFELYQDMLEEAVAALRGGGVGVDEEGKWSPQINVGTPVLIPENFVPDLDARMALYRRLSDVETRSEIDGFAAELIDRFGPLPEEVEFLLKIVEIKGLCRTANVEKIEAGPKGIVLTFRDNTFPNPAGLVELINKDRGDAKLRPDHKLVFKRDWETPPERLAGTYRLMRTLAEMAAPAKAA